MNTHCKCGGEFITIQTTEIVHVLGGEVLSPYELCELWEMGCPPTCEKLPRQVQKSLCNCCHKVIAWVSL